MNYHIPMKWSFLLPLALGFVYIPGAFADVTCDVIPAHISATATIHLSKFGVNYPISRGDVHLTSLGQVKITGCEGSEFNDENRVFAFKTQPPASAELIQDTQGNQAQKISIDNNLAVEYFYNNAGKDIYSDANKISLELVSTMSPFDLPVGIDLVSSMLSQIPEGSGVKVINVSQPISMISLGSSKTDTYGTIYSYTPFYNAVFLDSVTVNYLVSSCGVKSKQGSVVNWPNLTKMDISQGNAEAKPYILSLICGATTDTPTPVNITFSSTHGFADAANGIVNSGLKSVGLKLSWEDSKLPPIVLGEVNKSTLSGVGNYTVMAKPVKIASDDNIIDAGHFDTNVTMNIEFQ